MKFIKYLIIFSIFVINASFSREKPPFKNILVLDEPKIYKDIIFQDRDGNQINLNSINTDKIYILNFWATWCAPCKEEMPSLNNIKNISELKKINIIPINIGEEEYEKSKIFFDELGIDNLEIFSGPSGDLAKKFKLRGVPTTIILDKEGHEISRILGSIDFLDKQFLEWLKSIVNS